MPVHPSAADIAVRLILTVIASGLIGYDRGVRGHAAGLRTTLLVGLAAAIAMIQANLLLAAQGKSAGSFAVLDLMRMPLGILTGVGFIGGGAILKRGDEVSGLTTAATLWVTTVIGLCFGGGQNALGVAGAVLVLVVLFALKRVETAMVRRQRARLTIRAPWGASPGALPALLEPLKCKADLQAQTEEDGRERMRLAYELSWLCPKSAGPPLRLLETVGGRFEIVAFEMLSASPG